jgi:hypothetical protein
MHVWNYCIREWWFLAWNELGLGTYSLTHRSSGRLTDISKAALGMTMSESLDC